MLTKLSELKMELILAGILALLVSYFVWNYFHKDTVIDRLKETAVVQKIENAGLKEQVSDQETSAVITEKVNTQVKKGSDELRAKAQDVQTKTDTKVAKIEQTYKQLPATPENQVAKEAAKSAAVSEGMWDTYCTVKPDAAECSAK